MTDQSDISWNRILVEGVAIVASILIAFAIDAWWDLRGQEEEAQAYLTALETELRANRQIIDRDLELLRSWIAESQNFLEEVVSPGAEPSYEQVKQMVWETGPAQTTPL